MRRGYDGEYKIKKMLQEEHGEEYVFKLAIGSHGPDFIVLDKKGCVKMFIEVKTTRKNKWRPNKHDKLQFWKLIMPLHNTFKSIPIIYYIRTKKKWHKYTYYEIQKMMLM